MDSHISHNEMNRGVEEDSKCQICQEPIWENQWPSVKHKQVGKHICYYCYTQIRDGNYKPHVKRKSNLMVCDGCGKVSA